MKNFVLSIIILLSTTLLNYAQQYSFKHLNLNNGLSNATIYDIHQDYKGLIWVATADGLNRYDGYEFKIYKHLAKDSMSIASNLVVNLFEDSNNNLWISSYNGLSRYNREKDNFTTYKNEENNPQSIACDQIGNLVEEKESIWIANHWEGIIEYNKKNKTFKNYSHFVNTDQSTNMVYAIYVFNDSDNVLWVGSMEKGLFRFDKHNKTYLRIDLGRIDDWGLTINSILEIEKNTLLLATNIGLVEYNSSNNKVKLYEHYENNSNSISAGNVKTIFKDSDQNVWVATQYGLNIFDIKTGIFKKIKHKRNDNTSLSTNEIWSIMQDNEGSLWFGSYRGGINILNLNQQYFKKWEPKNNNPNNPETSSVISFAESEDGNIWLGIDHGGLVNLNQQKQATENITFNSKTTYKNPSNAITSSVIDNNKLWIGSYEGVIGNLNLQNKHFTPLPLPNSICTSIVCNKIIKDNVGNIWFATMHYGLIKYTPSTLKVKMYGFSYLKEATGTCSITSLYEDNNNNIWVGSYWGIGKYNKSKDAFDYIGPSLFAKNNINNKPVISIVVDQNNNLWFGTEGVGLFMYNIDSGKQLHLNENNGLINNVVYGILTDKNNNIWLSTNKGIAKLTLKNDSTFDIRNFDTQSGLQNNQFNAGAYFKSKTDELYFGNSKGFVYFHPDSIKCNKSAPTIVLSDFKLFNKSVKVGEKYKNHIILNKVISETEQLTLHHEHSVFSIEFSALSYLAAAKNQYAYMLEGFDHDWHYVGNTRSAQYTNLDPGTYTFRVKASNNDGIWNEAPQKLTINILPPWWETILFKIIIIIIVSLIAVSVYKLRVRSIKIQRDKLKKMVDERTTELQDANEELIEQQEEISQQNEELKLQNERIEQSHKHITDSINSAKRIQQAVLPSKLILEGVFPNSFIYYQPRDVVSGDFYWVRKIGEHFIFIAADCTGHGVPGAFVSMLGISFLNEISQNETVWNAKNKAALILELLRTKVKTALRQHGNFDDNKEGMDLALGIINLNTLKLQYAGANNPICIIRDKNLPNIEIKNIKTEEIDNYILTQIKPDPMPIGFYLNERPFANNEIQLYKNDKVYAFSDGYIDQFGGQYSKKLLIKNFRKILLAIHQQPMEKQKYKLENNLKKWMRTEQEQVDDILILGLSI